MGRPGMFGGSNTLEEFTGRREGHSPSACCSQAMSCSWMSLSPPAASSPVVEGKLVQALPPPLSSTLSTSPLCHPRIYTAQGGKEMYEMTSEGLRVHEKE